MSHRSYCACFYCATRRYIKRIAQGHSRRAIRNTLHRGAKILCGERLVQQYREVKLCLRFPCKIRQTDKLNTLLHNDLIITSL